MSIFTKLLIGFLALNFVIVGLGVTSTLHISVMKEQLGDVYDKSLMATNFARSVQNNFTSMELEFTRAVYTKDSEQAVKHFEKASEYYTLFLEDLRVAEDRAISNDSWNYIEAIRTSAEKWKMLANKINRNPDNISNSDVLEEMRALVVSIGESMYFLTENEAAAGFELVVNSKKITKQVRTQNLIISIGGAILGVVIAFVLSRNINDDVTS